MSETNMGALTGSKTYTGTVDSTNIFQLYKFNITNPGSFQLSLNGLTSNADVLLLNSSGTTLHASAQTGTGAETISVDNLIAGDYAVKVLQISGNTNYNLSFTATADSENPAGTDTLTGGTSDEPLAAKDSTILPVTSPAEKSTASKDPITGTLAEEKTDAPTNNSQVAEEKTANPTAQTTTQTETEKTVADTEAAISASEKPTAPATFIAEKSDDTVKTDIPASTDTATTATDKDAVTGETIASTESTTSEVLTAESETPTAPATLTADQSDDTVKTDILASTDTATTATEKDAVTGETASKEPTTSEVLATESETPTAPATLTADQSDDTVKTDILASTDTATTATEKDAVTGEIVSKEPTTSEVLATESETSTAPATLAADQSDDTVKTEILAITDAATATEKDAVTGETIATTEPKTSEVLTAESDASKTSDKSTTADGMEEDTKKEDPTTALPTSDTNEELETTPEKQLGSPFTSGIFTVEATGKVSIDYLLDGGRYRGQLAMISLKGMEKFVPGSEEFIKEAASRALSNSEKGHIVINDLTEGSRFFGLPSEDDPNEGAYLGVKTFAMTAGDEIGIMLIPNGTVKSVYDNPNSGGDLRPLFSMVTANPNEAFHLGQIADITGEGNTFAMEDLRFDSGTDKDYNDLIFQVRGAKGKAALMDDLVDPDKDWRKTDLGQALVAYAKPYITPEPQPKPNLEGEVSDLLDDLEKEILNPSTPGKETPKAPEPTAVTDKNTAEPIKVEATDKVDANPAAAVETEEKVKDTATATTDKNTTESIKVEATDKVDANPAAAVETEEKVKDTAVDSTDQLPVEKTPVSAAATEEKDKVAETTPVTPAQSTAEMETEVLPVESKTETEVAKPVTTEVAQAENPKVSLPGNIVETPDTKLPVAKTPVPAAVTEEKNKVAETPPAMPAKSTNEPETVAILTPKVESKPQLLPVESKTETEVAKPVTTEVVLPGNSVGSGVKESLPIPIGRKETTEVTPELPVAIAAPAKEELAQNYQDVNADWIARLESIKQLLSNLGSADVVAENAIDRTLIARLATMTEKLREQTKATPISDNTGALISRLEDMVVKVAPKPVEPVQPVQFQFPVANQPLVGVIDTGFSGNNPDINYSRIILGRDRVSNDANPLLATGEGSEHGTHILGIIGATQNNGVGIDGVNDKAPLWVGRAIGSGQWAESLVEFVNAAIESNQPNAVVNLSLDLTQVNPDGSVTTRYEFTPEERSAIEYARQHKVLLVVAAGNDGGVMSVLGQASQEFDNIITVGAAERVNDEIALSKAYDRSDYSSYGAGLDILADGGTVKNPVLSTTGDGVGAMAGTSVATAKVTGAISQVWAANPSLSYRQVIQIIKDTATDLKTPNWDGETGAGVVNLEAAVALALATIPQEYDVSAMLVPETWSGEGIVTPSERAAASPFWPTVESVNFYASVMPTVGANVRSGPGTNFAIVSVSPYQATIQFDGWTYGERIPDEQLGTPDERWYRIAGTNNWMASAVVFGNAPESTPLPPVQAQPQPLPPALLPGQGKVPANAGSFIKTVVSNQVTTHYYQNGYLMVQPNGQQSWYALGSSALPLLPVPVPKPVTVLPSPHGSSGEWQVQFWNNKNLSGNPTFTRAEPPGQLRFSAGGVPSGTVGIPADGFSARWETTSNFAGGFYNFISQADDGVRVYIDGVKVVDKWKDQPFVRNDAFVAVPKGQHKVVVEYFETAGNAVNNLRWEESNLLKNWTGELRPVGYDGGAVHDTYLNSYQRNGGISKLGYPINTVHPWAQGYTQDFEGGSDGKGAIMKSNANDNSYWVGNDFWTTLLATGGADGILKYPTSDRYFTKSGQRQNFQGGAVLKSKNGTFPIFGGMAGKYFDLGAENSFLGFPTSGEIGLGDGWIIQNFEGGYILYKEGMPTIAYDTKAIEKLPPDSGHGSTSNWHGQYWNNKDLIGSPQWSQYEQKGELRFAAGEGAPPNTRGIKEDNFGGRWITTSYFDGGIYNFINQADDGVRVYIDGKLTIDKWKDSAFEQKTAFAAIEPGYHQVMVEYFENGSAAANTLKWEQANPPKEWAGEFFRGKDLNDKNFAGNRGGGTGFLDKDWGNGHEWGVPIGDDDFSDRWSTTRYFDSAGIYKFTSQADDGVRVWVDDQLVIDKWQDQAFANNETLVSLDKGYHRIRVEHFENAGGAANKLSWQKLQFSPIAVPGVIGLVQQEPWVAQYFNNRDLSGTPVVTRTDGSTTAGLNLNWGDGSPDSRIQRDNFSSRLTTHRQLPAGTYKFKLQGDDGARLYINGEKAIDRWNDPPYAPHEVEITLPAGLHTLQVEHSEAGGLAYLNLDWDYSPSSLNYSIDPALQSTYNSWATQLGASAIGVPINQPLPSPFDNKIQEFRGTLGRGALLKRAGSPTVSYVFGKLWEAYQQAGGPNALGYPLSSQKDLGNGASELELPNGKLFWAPGMTNPTYYPYFNNSLTIPADSWRGEYFNNRDWAGSPAMVRGDSASASNLDKQWVLGSPGPGVQADNFSVRWTTNRPFDRGTYRFVGNHDDGFKVEVNGQAPIDKMIEVAARTTGYGTFTQPGQYPVQLQYREYGGGATAQLRMEKASDFILALDANNNLSGELPDAFNKHGGYDRVGVPTNEVHLWGNGVVQDFDGGANGWGILMRRHDTTVFYYVFGKIWDAYRNEGGAPGWLGYPTSDPFQEGGVTRQNFENGYITGDGQVHDTRPKPQPTPTPSPAPAPVGGPLTTQLLNGQLTGRYIDVDGYAGPQCWDLVAYVTGQKGSTTNWKRGANVMSSGNIPIGTAIATFLGPNGSYDNFVNGKYVQHTGIFAGYGTENGVSGFYIWDQNWNSRPVQKHFIRTGGSGTSNANNYHVIQF